jgi:hypothetical protein
MTSIWRGISGISCTALVGSHDDQGERRAIGNLATLLGKEHPVYAFAGREDFLDLLADASVNVAVFHASPAIRETLVQVLLQTETVTVPFRDQVVTGVGQALQSRFDIAKVHFWSCHRQADFWQAGLVPGLATVRFEEDGGGNFLVEGGCLDRLHGLSVQPYRMGLELAADVGGHCPFQTGFAKLFEHSRPELRIFQGGGP